MSPSPVLRPVLDPDFVPASLWNRDYRVLVAQQGGGIPLALALHRNDGAISVFRTAILPSGHPAGDMTRRYVERLLKFLLWQKGGSLITVAGDPDIAAYLRSVYA